MAHLLTEHLDMRFGGLSALEDLNLAVALKLKVDNGQRKLVPGLTADIIIPDHPDSGGKKLAEKQ